MTNFTFQNGITPVNGPLMDRKRTVNGPRVSWKLFTLLFALFLCIGQMWGAVKSGWTRVTDVSEITSGGTFIFGYESSAKTNVIVPMTIKVSATPSGNGYAYSGTKTTSNTTTIDMGNNSTVTTDYEYSVVAGSANGKVCIVVMDGDYKNYYFSFSGTSNGNMRVANTKSNSTDFTPTIGSNDVVSFTNVQYNARGLRFNTGNSPRFTNYGSTSQGGFVMYKKTSTCSKSVTLSKGTATNGTVNTISSSSVATCSSTASDRRVTVTITPAACFNAPDALTFTKSTGTVTATMQGTKTDNGDGSFSYIYQFAQDDNGSGTFGVTCSAKPAGKTVNFDAGAGTYTGSSLTEDCEGAGITLPSAVASGICKGWTTFAGWATAAVNDSNTTSGVTFYKAGDIFVPSSNGQTLYAVYSKVKDGGTTTLLSENFAGCSSGNNTSTSGSNSTWNRNENFYSGSNNYQAGGTVRLGGSSSVGYLITKQLTAAIGDQITISFKVKGWTSVEGNIQVEGNGSEFTKPSATTYTATMSDNFESKSVTVTLTKANPKIKIGTTAKRAFLDDLLITKGSSATYYCSDPNCCTPLGQINGADKVSRFLLSSYHYVKGRFNRF